MIIRLGCSHYPKTKKLQGIVHGTCYETLVCDDCKNDADLKNFREVSLS